MGHVLYVHKASKQNTHRKICTAYVQCEAVFIMVTQSHTESIHICLCIRFVKETPISVLSKIT